MGNCDSYDTCIQEERQNMRHPIDHQSLYANRITDNQTANKKCYMENPIHIIEGFGNKEQLMNILKYVVIAIVAYIVFYFLFSYLDKEQPVVNTGFANMDDLTGGDSELLKDIMEQLKL
jgi:hypothetical protein